MIFEKGRWRLRGQVRSESEAALVGLVVGTEKAKLTEMTMKGGHVCCKMCQKQFDELFKDAKVAYSGDGRVKDIKITGKELDMSDVQRALRGAGFCGKLNVKSLKEKSKALPGT